jgi:hypothetical protein
MENPASLPISVRFPTFIRLRRWLFGWRMIRRVLVALAALVTLVALFYAEEDWRGKHAWENYRRQAEARGVELNWHAYLPPPVPDAQNFAMTPFLAPLYDFNPKPIQPGQSAWRDTNGYVRTANFARGVGNLRKGRDWWHEGQMTDLAEVLDGLHEGSNAPALTIPISTRAEAAAELLREFEQYRPVLDEIRGASQRPYSRFNINYGGEEEDPWEILLPHLTVVKHLAQVLFFRSSAELELGKADEALEDLSLIFFLAHSIQDDPFVISHLVRIVILKCAEQIIWEGLAEHRWSEPQLRDIQLRLQGIGIFKEFEKPLAAERAADHSLVALVQKDPVYFSAIAGGASTPGSPAHLPGVFFRLIPKGWIYLEQLSVHRLFDEKILPGMDFDTARVHPRTIDDNASSLANLLGPPSSRVWHHRIFSALLLPALGKIAVKSAVAQTTVDEAALACALERYRLAKGEFPEILGALAPEFIQSMPHDIITGEPLKYRRTENGKFLLYSVGWNETDDGGKVAMNDQRTALVSTQGDWVWPEYLGK